VTGFERLSGGKSVPVIRGAVIFERDKERVIRESELMRIRAERR
jgi:hypothetical protein